MPLAWECHGQRRQPAQRGDPPREELQPGAQGQIRASAAIRCWWAGSKEVVTGHEQGQAGSRRLRGEAGGGTGSARWGEGKGWTLLTRGPGRLQREERLVPNLGLRGGRRVLCLVRRARA